MERTTVVGLKTILGTKMHLGMNMVYLPPSYILFPPNLISPGLSRLSAFQRELYYISGSSWDKKVESQMENLIRITKPIARSRQSHRVTSVGLILVVKWQTRKQNADLEILILGKYFPQFGLIVILS